MIDMNTFQLFHTRYIYTKNLYPDYELRCLRRFRRPYHGPASLRKHRADERDDAL